MRDDVDRLFERFRDGNDADALARLFDAKAPELLRLARRLVKDRAEAEDLLQATFVTAIEKAHAFESGRRVVPWLVGILARHAQASRRKSGRFLEVERLRTPAVRDPHAVAEDHEFRRELERALAGLPGLYREVLEPRLKHDEGGDAIARRVGRSPGVVRVQLSRGLGLLRQLLPHGLASSIVLALTARRSVAAARDVVLRHAQAATSAVGSAVAGATTSSTLGGVLVSKSLLALVALVVAGGAAFFLFRDDRVPEAVRVARDAATRKALPASGSTSTATVAGEASPPASREEAATTAHHDPRPATPPASIRAALATLRGRILEEDGRPVADTEVVLLELSPEEWLGSDARAFRATSEVPRIEIGAARTDATGRFTLPGARCGAGHALGIDLGRERATLRVLEQALPPGASTDLGDIVLTAGVALRGRVVDEDGAPIANARIRALKLPVPLAITGLQHVRADSVILRIGDEHYGIVPLPGWLGAYLDRLPVPSTRSRADGSFLLPSAPRGTLTLVVDHEAYVHGVAGPRPTGSGPSADFGTVVLSTGRRVHGVVKDARGDAVEGAEVVVGTRGQVGGVVVARRAGQTDAAGRFAVHTLPEDGALHGAVRRDPADPWTFFGPLEDDALALSVPATCELVLDVRDDGGRAVDPDDVRLKGASPIESPLAGIDPLPDANARLERLGPGLVRIAGLSVGRHQLAVRAAGRPAFRATIELRDAQQTVAVVLAPSRNVRVHVVDARTLAALEGVEVALRADGEDAGREHGIGSLDAFRPLVAGRTDALGFVDLGPVPAGAEMVAILTHPGYSRATRDVPLDSDALEIALDRGGSIEGSIVRAGNAPAEPLLFVLHGQGLESVLGLVLPRTALTDARGAFAIPLVPAGTYRYEVRPRMFGADLLESVVASLPESPALLEGTVDIDAGEPTPLLLDLAPLAAAKVSGHVIVDGAPLTGVGIHASNGASLRETRTDAGGAFSLSDLAPGAWSVSLMIEDRKGDMTYIEEAATRRVTLDAGASVTVDLTLHSSEVRVRVWEPGRTRPAANVLVQISGGSGESSGARMGITGADGVATVRTLHSGPHWVFVEDSERGVAQVGFDVPTAGDIVLELDPGVPCAGTFALAKGYKVKREWGLALQFIRVAPGGAQQRVDVSNSKDGVFRAVGLQPGSWVVSLWNGPDESAQIAFELPAAGATDLRFQFGPQAGGTTKDS